MTPVPTLTFVIPVFNEAAVLAELRRRVTAVIDDLAIPCEVLLVDDGSDDGSWEAMEEIARVDARFRAVALSRNFGHQVAVTAGLDRARGDAVVILDADLQDPPELVPELLARWREGYEVVYAVRRDRQGETWFKRATARWFYRFVGRLTETDIPADVGDFRLVDRRVVEAVRQMPERSRFLRGMWSWVGFRQIGVPYTRHARHAGETKYPLRRMVRFATDGVVNFSSFPLRLALNLGFFVAAVALLAGFTAIAAKVSGAYAAPGWASVVVVVSFIGGVQLVVLGVMGEYVGRIYEEVKRRPLYLVREEAERAPAAHRRIAALDGPERAPGS
jgi:dolichol-phosphate mannosyltransferase